MLGELVFTVEFEEPLAGDVNAKIWMMGDRADTPFEEMPKLVMSMTSDRFKTFDHDVELPPDSVSVTGTPTRIEMRDPLSLLGEPERVLMSVQSHFGDVPLDNVPWFS